MKKAIFIPVRIGSTRLPGKALLKINGKHTIEYVIEQAKKSKKAELVVLCTSTNPDDDPLIEIAKKNGIEYFRGSEKDKLERWKGSAQKYDVEFFVTADGDDLLYSPELMDLAFEQYEKTNVDFIEGGPNIICGAFTYAIKAEALRKVCEIKDTDDTEMMWVYFKDTKLFNVEELECDAIFKRTDIRLSMDYPEDFEFFKKVFNYFNGKDFNLKDVIDYLDKNPEVIKINQFRLNDWSENQKKRTKLILKEGN